MTVIFSAQTFSIDAWGEATIGAANTATITEQFAYAVALTGTLASGDTLSLVEQNVAHTTITLTCTGLGSSSTFVLQDAASNDFLFSNAPISIGDQEVVTTSGLQLYAPCFAQGTRLYTPVGQVSVETLRVGDAISTASGRTAHITWIGQRVVNCQRHPRPRDVLPVRIRAHALAKGMPLADLVLSPDHAVAVDGGLIPARYLCNGATIVQETWSTVSYHHVEVDRHYIVLAEGLPVESYLDTGNRNAFANAPGAPAVDVSAASVGLEASISE